MAGEEVTGVVHLPMRDRNTGIGKPAYARVIPGTMRNGMRCSTRVSSYSPPRPKTRDRHP